MFIHLYETCPVIEHSTKYHKFEIRDFYYSFPSASFVPYWRWKTYALFKWFWIFHRFTNYQYSYYSIYWRDLPCVYLSLAKHFQCMYIILNPFRKKLVILLSYLILLSILLVCECVCVCVKIATFCSIKKCEKNLFALHLPFLSLSHYIWMCVCFKICSIRGKNALF